MRERRKRAVAVEEEKAEEKREPMTAEDYEKLIDLLGKNLMHSIKNIQLAVEVAHVTSTDEWFKRTLERLMVKSREIENDFIKSLSENNIES